MSGLTNPARVCRCSAVNCPRRSLTLSIWVVTSRKSWQRRLRGSDVRDARERGAQGADAVGNLLAEIEPAHGQARCGGRELLDHFLRRHAEQVEKQGSNRKNGDEPVEPVDRGGRPARGTLARIAGGLGRRAGSASRLASGRARCSRRVAERSRAGRCLKAGCQSPMGAPPQCCSSGSRGDWRCRRHPASGRLVVGLWCP